MDLRQEISFIRFHLLTLISCFIHYVRSLACRRADFQFRFIAVAIEIRYGGLKVSRSDISYLLSRFLQRNSSISPADY